MAINEKIRRRLKTAAGGIHDFTFPDISTGDPISKVLPGFLVDRDKPVVPLDSEIASKEGLGQLETGLASLSAELSGRESALAAGAGRPVRTAADALSDAQANSRLVRENDIGRKLNAAAQGDAGVTGRIELAGGETFTGGVRAVDVPGFRDLNVAFSRRVSPTGEVTETLRKPLDFSGAAKAQIDAEDAGAEKGAGKTTQKPSVVKALRQQRIVKLQAQLEASPNPIDKQEIAQQIRLARVGQKTPWQKTIEKWTAWDYTDFMATKNPAAITSIQRANAADLAKMGQLQAQLRTIPKSESFEITQEIQNLATKIQENVQQQSASIRRQEDLVRRGAEEGLAGARVRREATVAAGGRATRAEIRAENAIKISQDQFDQSLALRKKVVLLAEKRHADALVLSQRSNASKAQIAKAKASAKSLGVVYDNQIGDVQDKVDAANKDKAKAESRIRDADLILEVTKDMKDSAMYDRNFTAKQARSRADAMRSVARQELTTANNKLNGTQTSVGLLSEKQALSANKAKLAGVSELTPEVALASAERKRIENRNRKPTDGPAVSAAEQDKTDWIAAWKTENPKLGWAEFRVAFFNAFGEYPTE